MRTLARKKKPPEHVNHERWLVSYADFITLLFAFFTTLYAISTVDAKKMGKMVMSMQASFDNSFFPMGKDRMTLFEGQESSSRGKTEVTERVIQAEEQGFRENAVGKLLDLSVTLTPKDGAEQPLRGLLDVVESALGHELEEELLHTRLEKRGLVVSLGEEGFFSSGSDQLTPEGKALLDVLATSLTAVHNHVRIEGHTDNVPMKSARFPSNWELSTARATSIVSYMIQKYSFSPMRLSASGYGEHRPIASNDTQKGRARNRRVDIVVLDPLLGMREPR